MITTMKQTSTIHDAIGSVHTELRAIENRKYEFKREYGTPFVTSIHLHSETPRLSVFPQGEPERSAEFELESEAVLLENKGLSDSELKSAMVMLDCFLATEGPF